MLDTPLAKLQKRNAGEATEVLVMATVADSVDWSTLTNYGNPTLPDLEVPAGEVCPLRLVFKRHAPWRFAEVRLPQVRLLEGRALNLVGVVP
jgi:hypothetical protein